MLPEYTGTGETVKYQFTCYCGTSKEFVSLFYWWLFFVVFFFFCLVIMLLKHLMCNPPGSHSHSHMIIVYPNLLSKTE